MDLHDLRGVVEDVVTRALSLVRPSAPEAAAPAAPPSSELPDDEHVAALLRRAEKVIVMVGAGLSTAAGIPDFRTPGTGLYYQLEKYELPSPQAIFSIDYFRARPEPFHLLAREMWPGNFAPTEAHAFLRLLAEKGKLLRVYTQNIDGLERLAGVPPDRLVECHGTFASAHSIGPEPKQFDIGWYKAQLDAGSTEIRCPDTGALVKPDIVFFGESLPAHFGPSVAADFPQCDLLLIIGTSLTVMPFAGLVSRVRESVPRVLVNMTMAGEGRLRLRGQQEQEPAAEEEEGAEGAGGFDPFAAALVEDRRPHNDVALLGDCQASARRLAELAGWGPELRALAAKQAKAHGARAAGGGAPAAAGGGAAAAASSADALAGAMSRLGVE